MSRQPRFWAACVVASVAALPAAAGSLAPPVVEAPLAVPPSAAPIASAFQGFHAYGGLAMGSNNQEITADLDGIFGPGSEIGIDLPDLGGQGLGLALGLGYDAKLRSGLVLGGFLDYAMPRVVNDTEITLSDGGDSAEIAYTLTQTAALTLGARLGVETSPSTLVYGLAGLTRATWEGELDASEDVPLGIPDLDYEFDQNGVSLGVGIETMLTERLSLRLEYRFTRFGTYDLFEIDGGDEGGVDVDLDTTSQSVMLAAGWRF